MKKGIEKIYEWAGIFGAAFVVTAMVWMANGVDMGGMHWLIVFICVVHILFFIDFRVIETSLGWSQVVHHRLLKLDKRLSASITRMEVDLKKEVKQLRKQLSRLNHKLK